MPGRNPEENVSLFFFEKLHTVLLLPGEGVPGLQGWATCGVGVVVAFQPSLHSNQIMLVHEENDVFSPENLTC